MTAPLLLFGLIFLGLNGDPLFAHMLGHWKGTGFRIFEVSGRRVEMSEDVLTISETVEGEPAILSRDQVTETAPGEPPNTYVTRYWVRAKTGQPGMYELGFQGPQGPGPASATGELGSDGIFRVDEGLGNGYVIHSETSFEASGSKYLETFLSGSEVQSRTEILYTPANP